MLKVIETRLFDQKCSHSLYTRQTATQCLYSAVRHRDFVILWFSLFLVFFSSGYSQVRVTSSFLQFLLIPFTGCPPLYCLSWSGSASINVYFSIIFWTHYIYGDAYQTTTNGYILQKMKINSHAGFKDFPNRWGLEAISSFFSSMLNFVLLILHL